MKTERHKTLRFILLMISIPIIFYLIIHVSHQAQNTYPTAPPPTPMHLKEIGCTARSAIWGYIDTPDLKIHVPCSAGVLYHGGFQDGVPRYNISWRSHVIDHDGHPLFYFVNFAPFAGPMPNPPAQRPSGPSPMPRSPGQLHRSVYFPIPPSEFRSDYVKYGCQPNFNRHDSCRGAVLVAPHVVMHFEIVEDRGPRDAAVQGLIEMLMSLACRKGPSASCAPPSIAPELPLDPVDFSFEPFHPDSDQTSIELHGCRIPGTQFGYFDLIDARVRVPCFLSMHRGTPKNFNISWNQMIRAPSGANIFFSASILTNNSPFDQSIKPPPDLPGRFLKEISIPPKNHRHNYMRFDCKNDYDTYPWMAGTIPCGTSLLVSPKARIFVSLTPDRKLSEEDLRDIADHLISISSPRNGD